MKQQKKLHQVVPPLPFGGKEKPKGNNAIGSALPGLTLLEAPMLQECIDKRYLNLEEQRRKKRRYIGKCNRLISTT